MRDTSSILGCTITILGIIYQGIVSLFNLVDRGGCVISAKDHKNYNTLAKHGLNILFLTSRTCCSTDLPSVVALPPKKAR